MQRRGERFGTVKSERKKGSIESCAYLASFMVFMMNILRDKAKR